MDQNPYQSPQTPAEVHSEIEKSQHNPPGCFAVGGSVLVFLPSGVISELMKPLEMSKPAEAVTFVGMIVGGLVAVW
jgi:hypothetical protein